MKDVPNGLFQSAVDLGNSVAEPVACLCGVSQLSSVTSRERKSKASRLKKTAALYLTMVAVSTCAIFLLEHATILNSFRTALVAAVGKTFAASWVTSIFE